MLGHGQKNPAHGGIVITALGVREGFPSLGLVSDHSDINTH